MAKNKEERLATKRVIEELNWQLPAPKQLLDKVEEIGKKEGRTRNAQAIRLLKEGVNMYNNDNK